MPNHVMNIITLYGEAEEIAELKKEYGMAENNAVLLDFNKVIPMPDGLNIEAGSETDHGIWLYLMAANPYDSWPEAEAWGYEKLSPEAYVPLKARFPDGSENRYQRERAEAIRNDGEGNQKERVKRMLALGKQAAENMLHYGATTWYAWCIAHWGTKWNAYGGAEFDRQQSNQFRFLTAWSPPEPVIQKLSQLYPALLLKHQWADENIGWNLGERIYHNGEIKQEEFFVGGSQEAIQYAEALFGWGEREQSERLDLQIE